MSKADKASSKKEKTETPAEVVSTGVMLQQLREKKGMGIQQVSSEIFVSVSNLMAIENADFSRLPADTFIRGQIAIYGNFLGVDGGEAARIFFQERDQQLQGRKKGKSTNQPTSLAAKKLAEPARISSATFAGILLLLIIVFATSFCLYTGWNPFAYFMKNQEQNQVQPYGTLLTSEPESLEGNSAIAPQESVTEPVEPVEEKATSSSADQSVSPPYMLTAAFTRDSGVDIVIDGQEAVHHQVKKDEQQQWQAEKSIQLIFEYPDSAVITVNGVTVPFPGGEQDGKPTLILPKEMAVD